MSFSIMTIRQSDNTIIMQKIYLYILALTAALTLAACDKGNTEPQAVRDYPTFSATILGEGTRASDTSWDANDVIGIYCGDDVVNLSHTHQGNGTFAVTDPTKQIIFTDNNQVKFTAYYPYGTLSTSASYKGKIATYATKNLAQTPADQKNFDYLWAEEAYGSKANPDVKFTFTHQMSKISLVFTSDDIDVSDITAFSIDGLYLKGTFDPKEGKCEPLASASPTKSTMTLKNYNNATVEDGVPAPPIIVFPQTLKANPVTLSVTASDAGISTITGSITFKDGELKAGCNYQFVVKISKTNLSVGTSTISEWTPVDRGDNWEAW